MGREEIQLGSRAQGRHWRSADYRGTPAPDQGRRPDCQDGREGGRDCGDCMTMHDELLDDELADEEAMPDPGPVAEQLKALGTLNVGQVSQAAHQAVYFTSVVNSANSVTQLLGRDYDRTRAIVTPVDGPVILAATQQNAQQSAAS